MALDSCKQKHINCMKKKRFNIKLFKEKLTFSALWTHGQRDTSLPTSDDENIDGTSAAQSILVIQTKISLLTILYFVKRANNMANTVPSTTIDCLIYSCIYHVDQRRMYKYRIQCNAICILLLQIYTTLYKVPQGIHSKYFAK